MTVEAQKETLDFQAEVNQLLHLMIHSLYSNKEIFLRELISNASDACDKLRFEALSSDALFEGDSELKIQVDFDEKARTVTIRDNGIGMSRDEVIQNIGTIAKSGTQEFFRNLTGDKAKDSKMIGEFGVGFYSSFVVADTVTLTTRRAGLGPEAGVRWTSDGMSDFSIETVERLERGTEVTLRLRETEDDLLNRCRLRNIITKYSDHIPLAVEMRKEDDKGKTQDEWETVNKASALWRGQKARSRTRNTKSCTSTSRTISRGRSRGRTTGSRASSNTFHCCLFRSARRSICSTAIICTGSNCTCIACSSWTTPNS